MEKEEEKKTITIVIAEDDDDDYELMMEAFKEAHLVNKTHRVKDGVELMLYLHDNFGKKQNFWESVLILLDLNMPRKDGREVLKEIKLNSDFKKLPIIILTTSKAEEDILRSYNDGANSYIRKPVEFGELLEIMKSLKKYWLEIVSLP